MARRFFAVAGAAAFVLPWTLACGGNVVSGMPDSDAIELARAGLDDFDALLEAGSDACNYQVKAPFEEDGFTEHMWLGHVERTPHGYRGTLDNAPTELEAIGEGDVLEVSRNQVEDWMIVHNEDLRIWGGYSIRAEAKTNLLVRAMMSTVMEPLDSEPDCPTE